MPIDPIGKRGGLPQVPGTSGPSGAEPTKAFEVQKPKEATAAKAAEAVAPAEASPLERLRAGKIDVDQYVELKLDQATAHLKGMRPAEVEQVRAMLRDKIVQDPHLVDLVRQATGRVPTPPEE
jgi:hypothetical protein